LLGCAGKEKRLMHGTETIATAAGAGELSPATATIAIDAFGIDLRYQSGIGVYGRSLANAYRAAGFSVAGLFGRSSSRCSDPLLTEISFHRAGSATLSPRDRVRLQLQRLTGNALIGSTRCTEIANSGVILPEPVKDRLQYFDRILNASQLFTKAASYFERTGRFFSVRLPKDIALMHWTMPLPIRAEGIPNIYTILDVIPFVLPYATMGKPRSEMRLFRRILAQADQVVTISEYSRRDISRVFGYDAERICNAYLSSNIDPDVIAESDAELATYLDRAERLTFRKYFVYAGSIEPRKNVDRLLDAYLKADTALPLVICSSTGWLNTQTLARLDHAAKTLDLLHESDPTRTISEQGKRIIRVSQGSDAHVARLIRGARALVYPSIYEGFGLPVLEAMELGTPVITAQASSTAEIAADAALLVDPLSVRDIAAAIDRIDRDEALCARLAQAGSRRAVAFSAQAFSARIGAMAQAQLSRQDHLRQRWT
jgi:glycosyltransferase involved in cell wall biosynthesis